MCFTTVERRPTKNFDGTEIKIEKEINFGGEEDEEAEELANLELPAKNDATKNNSILP